ncbi:MAG TPA: efflux RND transporter periplasmic adaptor subunit [bacterium]|nr:efflux RND transporter periplasmic adaptor subunit [bacterium]
MKKTIVILLAAIVVVGGGLFLKSKLKKPAIEEAKIRIVEASRGDVTQMVEASGSVVSNFDVEIKCKASGEIISLPFDASDVVKKGDLIAELDPSEEERKVEKARVALDSSRASRDTARQNLRMAERNLENSRSRAEVTLEAAKSAAEERAAKAERVAQLYQNKLASREEHETAKTSAAQARADLERAHLTFKDLDVEEAALEVSRQNLKRAEADVKSSEINLDIAMQGLEDTRVYAPMDGVVTARYVQTGQIISSGTTNVGGGTSIMQVSDLSRLYVLAAVDESDIGQVRIGQEAEITVDAYSGRVFKGRVDRISPRGEMVSSVVTFEVKIEVTEDGGMSAARGRSGGRRDSVAAGKTVPEADKASRAENAAPGEAADSIKSPEGKKKRDGAEGRGGAEREEGGFRPPPPGGPGFPGGEMRPRGEGGGFDPAAMRRDAPQAEDGSRVAKKDAGKAASEKDATAQSALSGLLKPQMTAHVKIIIDGSKDVVLAPSDAVWRRDGKFFVTLAAEGEEPAEGAEREVTIGISDGTNTEIASGLEEGEKLAVKAVAASNKWGGRGGGMPPMGGPMMRR